MKIKLIAAVSLQTRAIGKNGTLPWRLKEDLKRFHEKTMGHPVIMGRKTYVSLPPHAQPLAGRTNIVITSDPDFHPAGVVIARSYEEALAIAEKSEGAEEAFVIGGERVFNEAEKDADELVLTLVDLPVEGDTFFFDYTINFKPANEPVWLTDPENGIRYAYVNYIRKT